MKIRILTAFFLLLSLSGRTQQHQPVHIGIFTDCQYCNCATNGKRYYQLSLAKLDSCILEFNKQNLDGVFHLGDMIDHGYGNYDSVLPRFAKFNAPLHLVLGNHDYMIKSKYKEGLIDRIGLKKGYYKVDYGDWEMIVLNGDDLSYFAPQNKKQKQERNELVADIYGSVKTNGMPWNGGVGSEQMEWLDRHLQKAQEENKKVIVMCHFPLYSKGDHNLFNNDDMFAELKRYHCVKAYFNGHFHSGNYQEKEGIHLVNFKGMVDTMQNTFAVVTLTADYIIIKGYGREPDRKLEIRK